MKKAPDGPEQPDAPPDDASWLDGTSSVTFWPERRICTRCLMPVKQYIEFYTFEETFLFWLSGLCPLCQDALFKEPKR